MAGKGPQAEREDPHNSPVRMALKQPGVADSVAMFNLLDVDGNGVLTQPELMGGLSDLGVRDDMIGAIFIHMVRRPWAIL